MSNNVASGRARRIKKTLVPVIFSSILSLSMVSPAFASGVSADYVATNDLRISNFSTVCSPYDATIQFLTSPVTDNDILTQDSTWNNAVYSLAQLTLFGSFNSIGDVASDPYDYTGDGEFTTLLANTLFYPYIVCQDSSNIDHPVYTSVPLDGPAFTWGSVVGSSVLTVGSTALTPNPVHINNTLTAVTTFTDTDISQIHIATWNWGDGHTVNGTVTESNGSGTVSNTHTYAALGSYTVTLTVTNSLGQSSTSQSIISVIPTGGLQGGNLSGKNYSGANLSGQNISGANLSNGIFNNVNFSNANLSGANGSRGSYGGSNFMSANLAGGNFSRADFTGANLTSANLTGANVSNANFTNVNLTGANLTGANFHGTTMTGVTYANTICPNGQNSNVHNNSCAGQGGGL